MTQHLHVTSRPPRPGARDGARYRTACGRWVISAQVTGPSGVTCQACKISEANREAGQ